MRDEKCTALIKDLVSRTQDNMRVGKGDVTTLLVIELSNEGPIRVKTIGCNCPKCVDQLLFTFAEISSDLTRPGQSARAEQIH
ncbi:hypothetical protein P775_08275 [Puniceibacterium antarcticum]|uniref:Uncharacterized protein n=1 Tax=Puniceibacterium antarcticum TaxID=1206336 RepID=A0A2G8RG06_9RHOB|nr:hypothetical protein [Puniceibacterium antarcticum]PIL20515.1 hypothetical protein P775_08275 [Puniceibacterium antarcticum]